METYHNDYTKEEDEVLWEIHEIRRKVHEDLKNKPIDEINEKALRKFSEWQGQTQK